MWTVDTWMSSIDRSCRKATAATTGVQDARALKVRTRHPSAKSKRQVSVFTCARCAGLTTKQGRTMGSQISTFTSRSVDSATFHTRVTRVVRSTAKSTGLSIWQTRLHEPKRSKILSVLTRLDLCWSKIGHLSKMNFERQEKASGLHRTS